MACSFLPLPARIVEWGMRWLPHSGACPGACAGSRPPRSHRGLGHALATAFWGIPRGMPQNAGASVCPTPRLERGGAGISACPWACLRMQEPAHAPLHGGSGEGGSQRMPLGMPQNVGASACPTPRCERGGAGTNMPLYRHSAFSRKVNENFKVIKYSCFGVIEARSLAIATRYRI